MKSNARIIIALDKRNEKLYREASQLLRQVLELDVGKQEVIQKGLLLVIKDCELKMQERMQRT